MRRYWRSMRRRRRLARRSFDATTSPLDAETSALGAAPSAIARSYWRYRRGVFGDIGESYQSWRYGYFFQTCHLPGLPQPCHLDKKVNHKCRPQYGIFFLCQTYIFDTFARRMAHQSLLRIFEFVHFHISLHGVSNECNVNEIPCAPCE